MPNLRENPLCTDFYGLFQSTDKNLFLAESTDFVLLGSATTRPPHCTFEIAVSTRKKKIFGRIYIFFRTEFGYYTTPPPQTLDFLELRGTPSEALRLRRVNFFGYYPKSQDFSEFRLGTYRHTNNSTYVDDRLGVSGLGAVLSSRSRLSCTSSARQCRCCMT